MSLLYSLTSFLVGLYLAFAVFLMTTTGGTVFAVIPVMFVVGVWAYVTYRINKRLEFKIREV
jgi:MFS superfamily sulfate permease-like transporter